MALFFASWTGPPAVANEDANEDAKRWLKLCWLICVVGLCGYGMWIANSAWPLVGLLLLGGGPEFEKRTRAKMRSRKKAPEPQASALEKEIPPAAENAAAGPQPIAAPVPSSPAPLPSEAGEIEPEPPAALPRFPWRRSFALLILGWVAVGGLWNYGLTGLVLGSVLMAAVAMESLLCQARRDPRWMEKWRAANAWTRFNILGWIIGLAVGFMMLIGGMELKWNSTLRRDDFVAAPSREKFEAQYKGKEYQLIRRLDAFKEQVPAVELQPESTFSFGRRWVRDADPVIAWLWIVGGSMLLFFCWQQATGLDAFSVWKRRRGGWRQVLAGTGMVLASAACAYAGLYVEILPRLYSGGSFSVAAAGKTVVVRATVRQVDRVLDRWAAENGYSHPSGCRWSLQTVPKGVPVATVEVSDTWKALPYDRWRMRMKRSDWERPELDLAFEIVGTEKPAQSEVTIRSNDVNVGSQREKLWQGIEKGLSDALSKAADVDPTKAVEWPAPKQTETWLERLGLCGSQWPALCGVLAATLLWIFARSRRFKSVPPE